MDYQARGDESIQSWPSADSHDDVAFRASQAPQRLTPTRAIVEQTVVPADLLRIERALAIANTPAEVNQVIALMDAAVAYAKRFYKDQQDVIQRAKALRLQAERRLGVMLRAMPKNEGGRPAKTGSAVEPVTTIASLGIDKKTSMRAQQLAALPTAKFEAVAAGEVTLRDALTASRQAPRPVAAKPPLSEFDRLRAENLRLKDRIAELEDSTEEACGVAADLMSFASGEAAERMALLRRQLTSTQGSLDACMVRSAELLKQCAAMQRRIDKLEAA